MRTIWGILAWGFLMGSALFSPAQATEVAIPGSGDGVDVLIAAGEVFTQKTGYTVSVPRSIGSSGAIKAVGTDKAMLGRVARKIKDDEKAYNLTYQPVFTIPTVIFVNQGVKVEGLTEQQVLDIFSGKTTNWEEVGGSDEAVVVIKREDKDSSLANLRDTFPGFKNLIFADSATLAEKTYIMTAQIANRQGGIGFGPLDVAIANKLKVLTVNGKKATDADYPYFGEIALVYKKDKLDTAGAAFLQFLTSPEGHDVLIKAGGRPLR